MQAPEDLLRKYRGRYMKGWETLREERFERQKALGMFDESIKLPEWQSNHRKWEDLTVGIKCKSQSWAATLTFDQSDTEQSIRILSVES